MTKMKPTKILKLALHITGFAIVITASLWLFYCLLQIAYTGRVVVGVEPLLVVRVGEISMFAYGLAYAVYLLRTYILNLTVKKQ